MKRLRVQPIYKILNERARAQSETVFFGSLFFLLFQDRFVVFSEAKGLLRMYWYTFTRIGKQIVKRLFCRRNILIAIVNKNI